MGTVRKVAIALGAVAAFLAFCIAIDALLVVLHLMRLLRKEPPRE